MSRRTSHPEESFRPRWPAAAAVAGTVLVGLTTAGCTGGNTTALKASAGTDGTAAAPQAEAPQGTPAPNPLRNAYFGDLHVHTNFSYDAFLNGTRATPHDAYRYAKGGALAHPAGFEVQLDAPLDFYAVTDHASFLACCRR